jgi:hypothetical protein
MGFTLNIPRNRSLIQRNKALRLDSPQHDLSQGRHEDNAKKKMPDSTRFVLTLCYRMQRQGSGPPIGFSASIRPVIRGIARRTIERWQEWKYGIQTEACVGLENFGINDPACYHYGATSYIRFNRIMKQIPICPGKDVFADFGSGMGRVVVMAARYPFRRVIGVEICKEFNEIARENVRRAAKHLTCKNVELHCIDARKFSIPDDLSVVYFWSPFDSSILSTVFANLKQSLEKSPRELTIIYTCPPEDYPAIKRLSHELGWLTELTNTALNNHVYLLLYKYSPPNNLARLSAEQSDLAV